MASVSASPADPRKVRTLAEVRCCEHAQRLGDRWHHVRDEAYSLVNLLGRLNGDVLTCENSIRDLSLSVRCAGGFYLRERRNRRKSAVVQRCWMQFKTVRDPLVPQFCPREIRVNDDRRCRERAATARKRVAPRRGGGNAEPPGESWHDWAVSTGFMALRDWRPSRPSKRPWLGEGALPATGPMAWVLGGVVWKRRRPAGLPTQPKRISGAEIMAVGTDNSRLRGGGGASRQDILARELARIMAPGLDGRWSPSKRCLGQEVADGRSHRGIGRSSCALPVSWSRLRSFTQPETADMSSPDPVSLLIGGAKELT